MITKTNGVIVEGNEGYQKSKKINETFDARKCKKNKKI